MRFRSNTSRREISLSDFRIILVGLMAMVFALTAFGESRPQFRSPDHDAQLAFHKIDHRPIEKLIDKEMATEHKRVVLCTCRVLTSDQRPLFSGADSFDLSSGIPGHPEVTTCSLPGAAEVKQYSIPKSAVVRNERMTLSACEGMDGKTYKPDTTPKVACGKQSCAGSGSAVEIDTCKPYNARTQPAFWYCQASAL